MNDNFGLQPGNIFIPFLRLAMQAIEDAKCKDEDCIRSHENLNWVRCHCGRFVRGDFDICGSFTIVCPCGDIHDTHDFECSMDGSNTIDFNFRFGDK